MKASKKKPVIVAAIIIIIVAAIGLVYLWQGMEMVEVQTHSFLLDKGYTNADIVTIEVEHSFVNLILSRDEWTSTVVFVDEPDVQYHFTWEENAIISTGVSGEISDKSGLKPF